MKEPDISVTDAAARLGKNKQHIFKVLNRLGIDRRLEKSEGARGQRIAYISPAEFETLREYFQNPTGDTELVQQSSTSGVFYLIQLEPEHDPGRFKLGFASNIEERLRAHRTAAPLSKLVKVWPCKLLWEKTAIESISRGCERLYTEVFRWDPIDEILERCESFFALMPAIQEAESDD